MPLFSRLLAAADPRPKPWSALFYAVLIALTFIAAYRYETSPTDGNTGLILAGLIGAYLSIPPRDPARRRTERAVAEALR